MLESLVCPGIAGMIIAAVAIHVWDGVQSARLELAHWTKTNGYVVERADYLWWCSGGGYVLFAITVRDAQGRKRTGNFECFSLFFGVPKQISVQWDDQN